jgi:hypothetical protein
MFTLVNAFAAKPFERSSQQKPHISNAGLGPSFYLLRRMKCLLLLSGGHGEIFGKEFSGLCSCSDVLHLMLVCALSGPILIEPFRAIMSLTVNSSPPGSGQFDIHILRYLKRTCRNHSPKLVIHARSISMTQKPTSIFPNNPQLNINADSGINLFQRNQTIQ